MIRKTLLPTHYSCHSSIRSYRSSISLLLVPFFILIIFILFTSYSNDELEIVGKLRKEERSMRTIVIPSDIQGEKLTTEIEVGNKKFEDVNVDKEREYDEMMETGRDVIEKEEELAATFNSLLELPLPYLSLNASYTSHHNTSQSFNSSLIDSIISIHNDTNNENISSISSNEVSSINTTLLNASFYHDQN